MRNRGVTLVELLVVIAVIGGLIALLLPAVQSARKSARAAACVNHLKQIALGWHTHHTVHGHFPTGSWLGSKGIFVADPDRGFGKRQPGTWTYNILPYVEQLALHDAGRNRSTRDFVDATGFLIRYRTPVPVFTCPSRRSSMYFEVYTTRVALPANLALAHFEALPLRNVAAGDFAANSGHSLNRGGYGSDGGDIPDNYREADDPAFRWIVYWHTQGVAHQRSQVRFQDIEDGASQTYLVGERSAPDGDTIPAGAAFYDPYSFGRLHDHPLFCRVAEPPADPELLFDVRFAEPHLPTPDAQYTLHGLLSFGGPHPGKFNMAFCDGSVRRISYDIDGLTHMRLGYRSDGQSVDMSKLE